MVKLSQSVLGRPKQSPPLPLSDETKHSTVGFGKIAAHVMKEAENMLERAARERKVYQKRRVQNQLKRSIARSAAASLHALEETTHSHTSKEAAKMAHAVMGGRDSGVGAAGEALSQLQTAAYHDETLLAQVRLHLHALLR